MQKRWELMRWKNARGMKFIGRLDFDRPLCRQQRRGLTRGALSPMTLSSPAISLVSHKVIIIPVHRLNEPADEEE